MYIRPQWKWLGGLVVVALLAGCELGSGGDKPDAGNPAAARSQVNFGAVGASIANTPASAEASLDMLAEYIRAQGHNDAERAYGVYRWVRDNIRSDDSILAGGAFDPASQTPGAVFSTRKAVCSGFAQLFVNLCQLAGVTAETVMGYGVMSAYDPSIPVTSYNHLWCAVAVDGRWYLVEPSWPTSARLDGSSDPNFFFFTDPRAFAHRHLPYDEGWQLLDPPVSGDAFWGILANE